MTTKIEWTKRPGTIGVTWNPTRGCRRVSPGCEHCYAERMAVRLSGPGRPYEGLVQIGKHGPRWSGVGRFDPVKLAEPLRWRKPRTVFVDSMSDLFFDAFTFEQIAAVFGVMAATPQHAYLVLTKRPERAREFFEWASDHYDGLNTTGRFFDNSARQRMESIWIDRNLSDGPWPLSNVWLGASVEDQKRADERIPHLLRCPAQIRFLSCEPLLGSVDLSGWLSHGGKGWDRSLDALQPTETFDTEAPRSAANLPSTSSGRECGIGAETPTTNDTPDTEDGESLSASDGRTSLDSSKTWGRDRALNTPSTGSTTTATMSPLTAVGFPGEASPRTSHRPLPSKPSVEPSASAIGRERRASIGGPSSAGSGEGSRQRTPCRPDGIDWVIVGSESGPRARPMETEWARAIVAQCRQAGVACFVKQISNEHDSKGGNPEHWPPGDWPREWPEVRRDG